jgi:uncharacterized protein (TIGR00299 family) protein
MTILYYDCFSGISGDMNLGAMVDVGVDFEYLTEMLNKLSVKNEFYLHRSRKQKMGIEGTKIDVILNKENHEHTHHSHEAEHTHHHLHEAKHTHHHSHEAEHTHHHSHEAEHTHNNNNADDHHHKHEHRNLESIKKIINDAPYNKNIKTLSINMFMEVAKAEAKVHGKTIEEIHFHEVGAVDSIVDIIGAAICFDYLNVDKIISSSVELGGGFVKCAHGVIPVPAPATVEILKNTPVTLGKVNFETTTPTGAAILKANVNEFTSKLNFNIIKTGYGLGTKDFDIPNILRVYIATEIEDKIVKSNTVKEENNDFDIEEQIIIEVNIDDMNPELYEAIEEKLFDNGALDVYKTNILMKKNRPAIKLTVLTTVDLLNKIENILFMETTTLGIREYPVKKKMLKRTFEKVQTKFGEVDIKKGLLNGKVIKVKPEYETCKELAKINNVSILDIYSEVSKLIK